MAAQDGVVEAVLANGADQVCPPVAVGGWRSGSTANQASIRFGPFAEPVEADRVQVFINGEGPDEIRLGSTLRLPAGMPFTFDLSLAIT